MAKTTHLPIIFWCRNHHHRRFFNLIKINVKKSNIHIFFLFDRRDLSTSVPRPDQQFYCTDGYRFQLGSGLGMSPT